MPIIYYCYYSKVQISAKGMSKSMADLCDDLYKLPMYGHAESLNVSVAAGILMYDIARAMHE